MTTKILIDHRLSAIIAILSTKKEILKSIIEGAENIAADLQDREALTMTHLHCALTVAVMRIKQVTVREQQEGEAAMAGKKKEDHLERTKNNSDGE